LSREKSHKRASGHHSGASCLIALVSVFLVTRWTQTSCSRARVYVSVSGNTKTWTTARERYGCVSTPKPFPRLYEVRSCRVVHRSSRAERASGWTATKQGCDPGRSGRMGGSEVIVRKNAPPRRRTTRSGIIFYEGIVSVLYIGSLTTRCSVAACAPSLHPVLSPPCH
jgi:hypothetical protein